MRTPTDTWMLEEFPILDATPEPLELREFQRQAQPRDDAEGLGIFSLQERPSLLLHAPATRRKRRRTARKAA